MNNSQEAINDSAIIRPKKKGGIVILSDSESDESVASKDTTFDYISSNKEDTGQIIPKTEYNVAFDEVGFKENRIRKSIAEDLDSSLIEVRREPVEIIVSDTDSDAEESNDIIYSSSDEEQKSSFTLNNRTLQQKTLDHLIISKPRLPTSNTGTQNGEPGVKQSSAAELLIDVSPDEYMRQKNKINQMNVDVLKAKNMLNTVNLSALPDKGKLLQDRHDSLVNALKLEEKVFIRMAITKENVPQIRPVSWTDLKAGSSAVQPRGQGKKAMENFNVQKALTMECLEYLHGSLDSRPSEDVLDSDPRGLKVELMPHQKHAIAWLRWREKQKPSGGILADDMGLGKTLTMISLVMKSKFEEDDSNKENSSGRNDDMYPGGTLVVCPASLINQWADEVQKRVKRDVLTVESYHGPRRENKPRRLAKHDIVITTYAIIMKSDRQSAVFNVKWRRIVLDEAHQVRNHKSATSEAVCRLSANSRWALTGTPIHNKELDLYALIKFLRVSPLDELPVWKRWVADKSKGGQERINITMSSLMLRRTKAELQTQGSLTCLPERNWELIELQLEKDEMNVYHKVLIMSRTLFAEFLHQRAEKETGQQYTTSFKGAAPNEEFYKMHQKLKRMNQIKEIKQHHILVLVLRLRQVCCHPSLITGMLQGSDEDHNDIGDVEDNEEHNLVDQLTNLMLDDQDEHENYQSEEGVDIGEASKNFIKSSDPVFSTMRRSGKIKAILNVLKEKVLSQNDKAIVVSQWTGLLDLIAQHLKEDGIPYQKLDGKVPVHKRMVMVDDFNNPGHRTKVLLLSLTAGGVGLNLVGANHLLLMDLHWNPQLERQAQDRIYRVGQKKPVHVYKFMTVETIEQRIKLLQDRKLAIAKSVLMGANIESNKLSLDDLKLLFS